MSKKTAKKTLILAVGIGKNRTDWQVRALQMQISDWFRQNNTILPSEDVIIMPTSGEMKLFWLQGNPDDIKDVEKLDEIKDRITPVLEVALGIKLDPSKKFKHPKIPAPNKKKFDKAIEDLNQKRKQIPPKRIIRP